MAKLLKNVLNFFHKKIKFIEEHITSDYEVLTPSGFKNFNGVAKTVEFEEYEITTKSGLSIIAADEHIIIDEVGNNRWVTDLYPGFRIQTKNGIDVVKSVRKLDSKSNMFDLMNVHGSVYYTNGIVSHNTTTVGAFLLYEILFKELQTVGILANKGALSREILERIKNMYEGLPFWMQQGVVEWNKGSIELENGSRIMAASTSSSAVRGNSYTHLMLDEFAFVPSNIADDFMRSVYPTISSGKKSKVFIVSTPKGMNHFYKMWTDAVEGKSEYKAFEVNWNAIPGRDEDWKEQQIKNIGINSWNQEFEARFIGSSNTLIEAEKLSQLVYKEPIDIKNNVRIYEYPKEGHIYVSTVDSAHGLGEDYSVILVTDVTKLPYKVVAVYQDNKVQPIYFPSLIRNLSMYYNESHCLVEINDIGHSIAQTLWEELEYENLLFVHRNGRAGQQLGPGRSINNQYGLKMSAASKRVATSNLKMLIELDKLIINDFAFLEELTTFVRNSKNSFEADIGKHDDIVMAAANFAWMTTQQYFKDLVDIDVRRSLQEDLKKSKPVVIPHPNSPDAKEIENHGELWEQKRKEEPAHHSMFDPHYKSKKKYKEEKEFFEVSKSKNEEENEEEPFFGFIDNDVHEEGFRTVENNDDDMWNLNF